VQAGAAAALVLKGWWVRGAGCCSRAHRTAAAAAGSARLCPSPRGTHACAAPCSLPLLPLTSCHSMQTVPSCQALYKNSFTYHTVSASPPPLEECANFLGAACLSWQGGRWAVLAGHLGTTCPAAGQRRSQTPAPTGHAPCPARPAHGLRLQMRCSGRAARCLCTA
jgi:hypothetical protein